MKKISIILGVIVWMCFLANSNPAFAADTTGGAPNADTVGGAPTQTIPSLQNPLKAKSVEQVLVTLVDLAMFLGTIVAVLVFIWIGFQFVMAQGDSGKLKDTKKWFMYAAIGTAILIGSKVIVEVVKETFISAGVVDRSLWEKNL